MPNVLNCTKKQHDCIGVDCDKCTSNPNRESTQEHPSALIGLLAADVLKAEKGRLLAREIISTLFVNLKRETLPPSWEKQAEQWDKKLKELGG